MVLRRKTIILTGYRAVGKTTVGRLLADSLGLEFIDTDRLVERDAGCSISEMVGSHGWDHFRRREKKILSELIGRSGVVIAAGGGAVLHDETWRRLAASGLTVWLTADHETICRRLEIDTASPGQRPSLTGEDPCAEVLSVLAEREPMYRECAELIIDTRDRTPATVADEIRRVAGSNNNR